ncbi:MAG: sporulation protein YabP [Bacillota bacterium]|uniref:sporulation protein YabP n=1 Tax=Desulfurispora thermophila TaxID=265470 RepID=UPI00036F9C19|nr:sporulation protein YabP [Desulfurispora thermophila]
MEGLAGGQHSQQLVLENRKKLKVTGVRHVGSFNESEIVLDTVLGVLLLQGENMYITHLNLEEGILEVEGLLHSLVYREAAAASRRGKNILGRIFK